MEREFFFSNLIILHLISRVSYHNPDYPESLNPLFYLFAIYKQTIELENFLNFQYLRQNQTDLMKCLSPKCIQTFSFFSNAKARLISQCE